jgi:hypothetical protein
MSEDVFPTPLHSQTYDTGPLYLKYLRHPKDWNAVTVKAEFEDGGTDYLLRAADAPLIWDLEYNGLEDEDANILDEFWENHRLEIPFTFIEPRDHPWTGVEGNTYTGIHFESYERDHEKVWIQSRKIRLVKHPI